MFIKVHSKEGIPFLVNKSVIKNVITEKGGSSIINYIDGDYDGANESFSEIEAMLMATAQPTVMPYGFGVDGSPVPTAEFLAEKSRIDNAPKPESPFAAAFQYSGLPDGTQMFNEADGQFQFGRAFSATLKGFIEEALTTEQIEAIRAASSSIKMSIGDESLTMEQGLEGIFVTLMAANIMIMGRDSPLPNERWAKMLIDLTAFRNWVAAEKVTFYGDIIIDGTTDAHTRVRANLDNLKVGVFSNIHIMPF